MQEKTKLIRISDKIDNFVNSSKTTIDIIINNSTNTEEIEKFQLLKNFEDQLKGITNDITLNQTGIYNDILKIKELVNHKCTKTCEDRKYKEEDGSDKIVKHKDLQKIITKFEMFFKIFDEKKLDEMSKKIRDITTMPKIDCSYPKIDDIFANNEMKNLNTNFGLNM